jgi:hypothetical protein
MNNGTYTEADDAPYLPEKINMDVLVSEISRFCGLNG